MSDCSPGGRYGRESVRVLLLGPMEATGDPPAADPIDFGRRRHRELVAILALHHHRPVANDELAELLWEGSPPAAAGATIAGYVSLIRRTIGDDTLSTVRGAGYRLALPNGSDLDLAERLDSEAGSAVRRGDRPTALQTWRRAAGLWRGPVLGDLASCQWATPTAVRYDELRVRIAEQIIDLRLGLGHHHDLVAELEQLVADHPLRERLWGQLMVALYRSDRQGEALRAYSRVARHLTEWLGISPSTVLRDLEGAILRQAPEIGWTEVSSNSSWASSAAHGAPIDDNSESDRTHFVGRRPELAQLGEAWQRALRGDAPVVAISGPAGMGKTLLAARAGLTALEGRHRFLRGRCLPNAGIFQPFVDIFRSAWDRADLPQRRHLIGDHAPELSALLPDRTAEFLAVAGSEALTRSGYRTRLAELDADYARRAMTMALFGTLGRIAEDGPVVFLIDDVHLADPSTASLLGLLMQRPIPRALSLLTIRLDELAAAHDVTQLIGDGVARGAIEVIRLGGFDRADVVELLGHHHCGLDDEQQLALLRRSGGNPFLCTQLLGAPPDQGVPDGAVAFVRARLHRLVVASDPFIDDVLSSASLLGPSFPVEILAGCVRVDTLVLFDALDQMARVGIVQDDPSQHGWFQFVPEIVRDVVLLGLPPSRQRIGHRRISEAWAHATGIDEHTRAGRVVFHELQAGPLADRYRLATAAIIAAEAALELAAFGEALDLSQAGLGAVARPVPGLESAAPIDVGLWPVEHIRLRLLCFRALDALGRRAAARDQAQTALLLSRAVGDAELICRSIDACTYGAGVIEQASQIDLITEVAGLVQPTMDAGLRARLLTHQLYESTNGLNPDASPERLAAVAMDLADRVEDLADRVELLQCVAETLGPADRTGFDAIVDRCEQLAFGRPTHLGLARDASHLRVSQNTRDGNVEAMRRNVAQHREIALTVERERMLAASAQKRALLAYFEGDLVRSDECINEMITLDANPDYQIGFLAHLLVLRRDQGRMDELVSVADELLDGPPDRWVTCGATLVYALNGNPKRAQHAIDLVRPSSMEGTFRHPGGLFLTCCVAEAATRIDDTKTVGLLRPLLVPSAARHASMMSITSMGPVARIVAQCAITLGEDPSGWFHQALETPGAPTHRARTILDWAEFDRRRPSESRLPGPSNALVDESQRIALRCGAIDLAQRASMLQQAYRLRH